MSTASTMSNTELLLTRATSPNFKSAPITLITLGYRVRVGADEPDTDEPSEAADEPNDKDSTPFLSLTEQEVESIGGDLSKLQALWVTKLENANVEFFVKGAGKNGIFTQKFLDQVLQITNAENIWCPTEGLGMVNLAKDYPKYTLGEYESDIKLIGAGYENNNINKEEWWGFISEKMEGSISNIVIDAIKKKHQVFITIPGQYLPRYKRDFKLLYESCKSNKILNKLYEQVRFFGADLDKFIYPQIMQCAMPFDREALDKLVPGVNSHSARRMARLGKEVLLATKEEFTTPQDDYDTLDGLMKGIYAIPNPIEYKTGSIEKTSNLLQLTDVEAYEKLMDFAKQVGKIPVRLVRLMRSEGYSMSSKRAEMLLAWSEEDLAAARTNKTAITDDINEDDDETEDEVVEAESPTPTEKSGKKK
jgi:hypothetical protein